MSENILEKILKNKRKKIDILKKSITANELDTKIQQHNNFIDFKNKIKKNISLNKTSIIAEIKKASPSAGMIIEDYNPIEIANIYQQNKATCLSILTEEDFFLGNLIHISKVKQKINLPILCKDFLLISFKFHFPKATVLMQY